MGMIHINIFALENAIEKMKTLSQNWSSNYILSPAMKGSGKTANELEEIAQLYKDLNQIMVQLASETAQFLESIKVGYEESDRKADWNIFRS